MYCFFRIRLRCGHVRIINGSFDVGGIAKSSAVFAWLRVYLIDSVLAHAEVGCVARPNCLGEVRFDVQWATAITELNDRGTWHCLVGMGSVGSLVMQVGGTRQSACLCGGAYNSGFAYWLALIQELRGGFGYTWLVRTLTIEDELFLCRERYAHTIS